jgi:NAD(P)-dependent dehydrogenase (short-subunit alcohol dehydrogenase family)
MTDAGRTPEPAGRDMAGRVCLVTGATSGIGREAAAALARRGATLIMVSRDPERGRRVCEALGAATRDAAIELEVADLERQSDVRALAARVAARHVRLHVLVNNAGSIFMRRRLTPDGIEATLALNHLAPFLLTNLLLDRLRAAAPARVVTVASDAHRVARFDFDDLQGARRYSGVMAYALTKAMNILFTIELARRLEGTGVTANAAHPGGVDTAIWRRVEGWRRLGVALMRPFLATPERGAAHVVALAADARYEGVSGCYFAKGRPAAPSAVARDRAAAQRLWILSASLAPIPAA